MQSPIRIMTTSNSNDYLYNSPRAVIDMRLFEVDDDKLLLRNLDCLRTPMSLGVVPSNDAVVATAATSSLCDSHEAATEESTPLPPLNTLSVSSGGGAAADDASSVSSVSLDDVNWNNDEQAAPVLVVEKRCIFPSYWQKKGGRPKQPLLLPPACMMNDSSRTSETESMLTSSSGYDQHSYEHLLENSEASRRRSSSSSNTSRRRRLWDDKNRYVVAPSVWQSEPALAEAAAAMVLPPHLRKAKSAPTVRPKASCLRKGRFSSSEQPHPHQRRRASTDSSVSFSDNVQIQYLKPVAENWASRGWSKHFM